MEITPEQTYVFTYRSIGGSGVADHEFSVHVALEVPILIYRQSDVVPSIFEEHLTLGRGQNFRRA